MKAIKIKKLSQIFYILIISSLGILSGSFVGGKISNIDASRQSAEIIYPIIENEEEIQIEEVPNEEPVYTTCPKPDKEYNDMFLLPIGQDIGLPNETYIPSKLREIDKDSSTREGICLIKEARNNFELLTKRAEKDGLKIKAVSGYRSYEYQKGLLAKAIANGNKNADIAIAKAGYSEHQLGSAVDLTGKSIGYAGASIAFDNTVEAEWLEENASDFGFIRSYPEDKEDITGYMYEPWHYRYVGVDIAKEIIKSEQTINQYLESL